MDPRARRRANIAVGLDVAWVVTLVVLWPNHGTAAGVGIAVLVLGLLAKQLRPLGYVMAVVRLLAGLLFVVVAVESTAYLILALVAAVSAANGVAAARSGAPRTRRSRARSERFEVVGSAMILFGIFGLTLAGLLVDGRFAASAGFVVWWIALMWGTTAVHEAGHAVAALRTGNEVPDVRIGVGLKLFRVGRVTVGAVPFVGHTRWAVNEASMTSRRELCIALAGPAANLFAASALLAIVFVHWDALVLPCA